MDRSQLSSTAMPSAAPWRRQRGRDDIGHEPRSEVLDDRAAPAARGSAFPKRGGVPHETRASGRSAPPPGVDSPAAVPLGTGALRRRPLATVASVLVIVVSGAVAASAYQAAGHKAEVIAVKYAVPQGGVITAADLHPVRVSPVPGVALLPVSQARRVVGAHAAIPLVPGSLLTPADLSAHAALHPGESLVGIAAKSGQIPAEGVSPGQWVELVLTDPPGQPLGPAAGAIAGLTPAGGANGQGQQQPTDSNAGGAQPGGPVQNVTPPGTLLVPDALVEAASPETTGASSYREELSVEVPSALAGVIAAAATAGQVSVAVVSPPAGS